MYLSPLHAITQDSLDPPVTSLWFSKQPLGKNKLGDLAKTMSAKGGINGRKVNHSARKTTVTSLLHSNIEATQIMQLTGHRNVQSINQYSSASIEQLETMSHTLSNISCGNSGDASSSYVSAHVSQQASSSNDYSSSVVIEPSTTEMTDDELASVDMNDIMSSIECYENKNVVAPENTNTPQPTAINNQPTVIDLAPILPSSKMCLLPHAKIGGNVTINFYGATDMK